jgi:hypothetical protein
MGAIVIRTRYDEGTESTEVATSGDDLLLLFWFIWVYLLFIIKYLKLLIIENNVLIFQFYK